MAFELYGMLAGNVSPMTGENIKPAYGGEDEAFLRKVVTPIYNVIAEVFLLLFYSFIFFLSFLWLLHPVKVNAYRNECESNLLNFLLKRKLKKAKGEGQSIHNGGTMMI
jgi:hypothetical protein